MKTVETSPPAPVEVLTSTAHPLGAALEQTARRLYGGDSLPEVVQRELEDLRAAERAFRALGRMTACLLWTSGAEGMRESEGEFVIATEGRP